MEFFNKFERKFGRFGIRNLSLYIIIGYIIGYLLNFIAPQLLGYLSLDPYYILKGQVWRIVTWIIIPPSDFGVFTIVMLYCYYNFGAILERSWGKFRFTLYIVSGIVFTFIGAMILYIFMPFPGLGSFFSTYYVNMAIFLAFTISYPNMQVNLYFIIPIKAKWLGYLYAAYLLFMMVRSSWPIRVSILASVFNVIIFFLMTRDLRRISPKEVKRRKKYVREVKKARGSTTHKCAICGRTEEDGEHLEFRYCSKCDGNYEYCQDHLFTHEHIKKHN
jgi:MFS family permease